MPETSLAINNAPVVTTEQMDLIKRTVAKDATPDELKLYFFDCQRQGVHPLDKLIHFTKRAGKYTPVTSIDFMRSRASDSGEYAGNDDPQFAVDAETQKPTAATVTVYRMVQNTRCSFTATARWSEYVPEQAFMWKKMPYTMLGKCAEALALRKAFPRQLSGLYSAEEMDQAGKKAQAPENAGELASEVEKPIRLAGIMEDETEKGEFFWYKIKTLTNEGEATVRVRSPKETDSGRLAEKVGWLIDIEVIETDRAGVFALVKVLNVRKPVTEANGDEPAQTALLPPETSPAAPNARQKASGGKVITDKQKARLFAIANSAGFTDDQVRELAGKFGVEHISEMTSPKPYDDICKELELYVGTK